MSEVKYYPPYLDYPKPRKKQTNADCIRAMTDEELTAFLHGVSRNCWDGTCLTDCPLHDACAYESHFMEEWLKQEVSDNG